MTGRARLLQRSAARCHLIAGEQRADRMIGKLVAHDPAVALRDDNLAGPKVPQRLRDRRVLEAGGHGEIGDADRPGGPDADKQHKTGRISQDGEVLRQCPGRCGVPKRGDGFADPFAVDDALICAVGRNEMHAPSVPLLKT